MTHKMIFIFSFILPVAVLVSCQSGSKRSAPVEPPDGYTPPEARVVFDKGESYGARFSNDGKSLFYISRGRAQHKQAQAYVMDLTTRRERRLTFQDGDVFEIDRDPTSSERFFYTSTTDENKERPEFIRNATKAPPPPSYLRLVGGDLPPTEIYLSTRDGRTIRRLTNSEGFDGQLSASSTKSEIVFTTVRQKRKTLYSLATSGESATRLLGPEGDDESPALSPDGKSLAWSKGKEIWLGDSRGAKAKAILKSAGLYTDLRWHPNGEDLLFASNFEDTTNFEIYVARKDGSCLRRLSYDEGLDHQPEISPNGQVLVFTSNRSGQLQVYSIDYTPPPCPALPPPGNI
jgi:Tol biopolymer transport system component